MTGGSGQMREKKWGGVWPPIFLDSLTKRLAESGFLMDRVATENSHRELVVYSRYVNELFSHRLVLVPGLTSPGHFKFQASLSVVSGKIAELLSVIGFTKCACGRLNGSDMLSDESPVILCTVLLNWMILNETGTVSRPWEGDASNLELVCDDFLSDFSRHGSSFFELFASERAIAEFLEHIDEYPNRGFTRAPGPSSDDPLLYACLLRAFCGQNVIASQLIRDRAEITRASIFQRLGSTTTANHRERLLDRNECELNCLLAHISLLQASQPAR